MFVPHKNPLANKAPIQEPTVPPPPPEEVKNSISDMMAAARQESMVVDKELAHLGKEITDAFKKKDTQKNQPDIKEAMSGRTPDEIAIVIDELLASFDTEKKTRKKKTPLDQKLEELALLEDLVVLEQLSEEERKEFKDFFDNMARLKKLKARLKQLEDQEDEAENKMKREKSKRKPSLMQSDEEQKES